MKSFPVGTSAGTILDWITDNGVQLMIYTPLNCPESKVASPYRNVTIQGTVVDTLGRPLKGETVFISDISGKTETTQTDASGFYRILGSWANGAIYVRLNPKNYSNGPFQCYFDMNAVDGAVVVMPSVLPTPIRA